MSLELPSLETHSGRPRHRLSTGALTVPGRRSDDPPPLPQRQQRPRSASDTPPRDHLCSKTPETPETPETSLKPISPAPSPSDPLLQTPLTPPKPDNYRQNKLDGAGGICWTDYLQAWVDYVEALARRDHRVDDRPDPSFSIKSLTKELDALFGLSEPWHETARAVRRVYRWENKVVTGALLTLYYALWWHGLLLPFVYFWLFAYIVSIRLESFAQLGMEALEEEPATEETARRLRILKWFHRGSSSPPRNSFKTLDHKSIYDWWADIRRKYGPRTQRMLGDYIDRLERVKNLFMWRCPARARALLALLAFLMVLPHYYLIKIISFWAGVEFFVLQAARSHYPRHRRLFHLLDWVLWGVPNDEEYRQMMVHACPLQPLSPVTSTSLAPTLPSRSPPTPEPERRSTDISKRSAAAAIGVAVATATAKQVQDLLVRQLDKDGTSESLADRGLAFSCMFQDVPGRILLSQEGFQFRTSRFRKDLLIVDYAWHKISHVDKKRFNHVLVLHSDGLVITLDNGEIFSFDRVSKRDQCFQLVQEALANADTVSSSTSTISV